MFSNLLADNSPVFEAVLFSWGASSTIAGFSSEGGSSPSGGAASLPDPSSICRLMLSSVTEMPSARGFSSSDVCSSISGSAERSTKERCTTTSLPPSPWSATASPSSHARLGPPLHPALPLVDSEVTLRLESAPVLSGILERRPDPLSRQALRRSTLHGGVHNGRQVLGKVADVR